MPTAIIVRAAAFAQPADLQLLTHLLQPLLVGACSMRLADLVKSP